MRTDQAGIPCWTTACSQAREPSRAAPACWREEFLDEHLRIFPGFQIALVDPALALRPAIVSKQPVISIEPEADQRPFDCVGYNDRFQLCLRWGMLPFFRSDHEGLTDILMNRHALRSRADASPGHD